MTDRTPSARLVDGGREDAGRGRRDRGISSILQYVLVLFLIALLVSGLVFGFGSVVLDQRERAVRSNFEVLGHHVADGFGTVDRLALDENATAAVHLDLPRQVAGVRYDLTIVSTDETATVVLSARRPDVTVRVTFRTRLPVRNASVNGGPVTIRYDSADDVLEVVPDE